MKINDFCVDTTIISAKTKALMISEYWFVIQACANNGTHYCDLTGEPQFVRRSIAAFDAKAKETGAKIVHSCGYDSIPSDLTTLELINYSLELYGQAPDEVTTLQDGAHSFL